MKPAFSSRHIAGGRLLCDRNLHRAAGSAARFSEPTGSTSRRMDQRRFLSVNPACSHRWAFHRKRHSLPRSDMKLRGGPTSLYFCGQLLGPDIFSLSGNRKPSNRRNSLTDGTRCVRVAVATPRTELVISECPAQQGPHRQHSAPPFLPVSAAWVRETMHWLTLRGLGVDYGGPDQGVLGVRYQVLTSFARAAVESALSCAYDSKICNQIGPSAELQRQIALARIRCNRPAFPARLDSHQTGKAPSHTCRYRPRRTRSPSRKGA